MSFIIAVFSFFHLQFEPFSLIDRIVQFGEAIGQFTAVDVGFETDGIAGIGGIQLGERRNFDRMSGDVDRLDEVFFHVSIEAGGKNLAESVVFAVFHFQFICNGTGIFDCLTGIEVFPRIFLHGLCHGQSRPGRSHVDFRIFIGEFHGTVGSHGAGCHHLFRLVDDVFDIPIGLVCFDGSEFRIVAGIHSFISEVSGDFKNPFITAHEESLQVQFRSDSKVHGHIKGIEVGHERLCIGSAVKRLEYRGFHFQETIVRVPFADSAHHGRSLDEGFADFRIHDEIQVSLAIALFLVSEAMPFFRQRTEGLGEHFEMEDPDGEFSGMGGEDSAFHAQDITDIYQFEKSPFIFRQFISSEINLHITALVAKHAESGLALAAADHETAGNANAGFFFFQLLCMDADIGRMMVPGKFMAVRLYAEGPDFFQLFAADEHLVIQLRSLLVLILFLCHSLTSFPKHEESFFNADNFVLQESHGRFDFHNLAHLGAHKGTAYRGFIGNQSFEGIRFGRADDLHRHPAAVFRIFDYHSGTYVDAVFGFIFNHLGSTDLLFQIADFTFQKCLGILCFIIFGVFRKVAHGDSFLQALSYFRTFGGTEIVQSLLHFFKAFFSDQSTLHFCHNCSLLFIINIYLYNGFKNRSV